MANLPRILGRDAMPTPPTAFHRVERATRASGDARESAVRTKLDYRYNG